MSNILETTIGDAWPAYNDKHRRVQQHDFGDFVS